MKVVDAPVSGGTVRAANGTLTMYVLPLSFFRFVFGADKGDED